MKRSGNGNCDDQKMMIQIKRKKKLWQKSSEKKDSSAGIAKVEKYVRVVQPTGTNANSDDVKNDSNKTAKRVLLCFSHEPFDFFFFLSVYSEHFHVFLSSFIF